MFETIPNKGILYVLFAAGLLSGVLATYQLITGEVVQWWGFSQRLSAIVFAIDVIFFGMVALAWRQLWRWFPSLNCWIFPDLNGEWVGTISSTHDNKMGEVPTTSRQATLRIRQGWKRFSVELITKESRSLSTNLELGANRSDKLFSMKYNYLNNPIYQVRNRSQRHDGTAELRVDFNANPDRLIGTYFTDRFTAGNMDFMRSVN